LVELRLRSKQLRSWIHLLSRFTGGAEALFVNRLVKQLLLTDKKDEMMMIPFSFFSFLFPFILFCSLFPLFYFLLPYLLLFLSPHPNHASLVLFHRCSLAKSTHSSSSPARMHALCLARCARARSSRGPRSSPAPTRAASPEHRHSASPVALVLALHSTSPSRPRFVSPSRPRGLDHPRRGKRV